MQIDFEHMRDACEAAANVIYGPVNFGNFRENTAFGNGWLACLEYLAGK